MVQGEKKEPLCPIGRSVIGINIDNKETRKIAKHDKRNAEQRHKLKMEK